MVRGRKKTDTPELKTHKPSGRLYLLLDGHRHYLGRDREKAEEERRRLLAESLLRPAQDGQVIDPRRQTVETVTLAYEKAELPRYSKDQQHRISIALDAVCALYGSTPAEKFDRVRLDAVRGHLLRQPNKRFPGELLSRSYVNSLIGCVQTVWTWLADKGLVPDERAAGIAGMRGLRKGCGGRELPAVLGVADVYVDRTLPHLNYVVRAMVQVQRLAGLRPAEVCSLRVCDLSRDPSQRIRTPGGETIHAMEIDGVMIWAYAPQQHKTLHLDKPRVVAIGPRAQEVLWPFLEGRKSEDHLFSAAEAMAVRSAEQRALRKTHVQPTQAYKVRRKRRRKREPGKYYKRNSYYHVVAKGIERANQAEVERRINAGEEPLTEPWVPHWSPAKLRHTAGTEAAEAFDQHHAQAMLGHTTPDTTATYLDRMFRTAAATAAKLG